jgi:hypothetical protein
MAVSFEFLIIYVPVEQLNCAPFAFEKAEVTVKRQ